MGSYRKSERQRHEKKFRSWTRRRAGLSFTLSNDHGVEVSIINYGGAVTSILAPDRNGVFGDVVLGYETLDEYMKNPRYLGALIECGACEPHRARKVFAQRSEYQLAQNNGANHLHGGVRGFDKRVWTASETADGLHLELISKDGEENYPGNLNVAVDYSLNDQNELGIDYHATTDKDTIVISPTIRISISRVTESSWTTNC